MKTSHVTTNALLYGALTLGIVLFLACLVAPDRLGVVPLAHGALKDDFDRFDGKGETGVRVDVIEWAGNLEIHTYPKGSLAGLGLKLHEKDGKKVMVIAYRFSKNPAKTYIRRAILGVPFKEGFQAFRDTTADDYDKVIITNQGLTGSVVAYNLDKAPTQLYPDGHPALAGGTSGDEMAETSRKPAATDSEKAFGTYQASKKGGPAGQPEEPTHPSNVDENGTIRFMKFDW